MASLGRLAELLDGRLVGDPTIEVHDVVMDSRSVASGSLFCCVKGERDDGHDHADEAVRVGAVALLCERELSTPAPALIVDDVRPAMAVAAAHVHGSPSASLDVVGVTGTNGKTTVVSMIEAIMVGAGRKPASIGTLTGARTTPEAPDLQRQLASMLADGVDTVAMEVSSHALSMHRVDAVDFAVAVFTNLGTDHLDFHSTPEAYFAAKARLFEPGRAQVGVIFVDDLHGRLLVDASEIPVRRVSMSDAGDLVVTRSGSRFRWNGVDLLVPMHGRHNVANALLAAEACALLGVEPAAVAAGLAALSPVPGRFETFELAGGAMAVVDYAHTPDALEQILGASRELAGARGKVVVVFGCGGERDRSKRPMMGRVASELADRVVLTNDNPRSEDPAAIVREIITGVSGPHEIEMDRAAAIRSALASAGPDDVVVIAGKGHEQGQVFADRTLPFDDRAEVRAAIHDIGAGE